MPTYRVTAHKDFPMWMLARCMLKRVERSDELIDWTIEAPNFVTLYPISDGGVHAVVAADAAEEEHDGMVGMGGTLGRPAAPVRSDMGEA